MCCHLANQNKHPGSLRGHICHNKSVISSKLRWFHRIPDLQKARNKTCRHLTVYIEVCIALLCGFADTAFPQKLIEKTQMKVQIVTCLEVLAFEMNSGRILVQISSIQVFKGFLGFVDPREVTKSPFLGSFSHCIPASGAHRPGGWLHKHCAMLFPTASALPSPYTTTFTKSAPSGHRLRGNAQSTCSFL